MAREPRFPGIEWYCDHCGALLSEQKNFDDHKYTWKCRNCGYKNSISWDNINREDSLSTRILLHLLGFLSFVGLWTSVMLGVAMFAFGATRETYMIPFLGSLGLYLFADIISILVEFLLRRTRIFSAKNLIRVIIRNVKEELFFPGVVVKELISTMLSFITRKLPFKKKYEWHTNKEIVGSAIIYTIILLLEFITLSSIINYEFSDWIAAIAFGFSRVKDFVQRFR